jgi:hypothetical protein
LSILTLGGWGGGEIFVVFMEFPPKVIKNVFYPTCTQCLVEKAIKRSKSIALSKTQLSHVRLLVLMKKKGTRIWYVSIYQQKINYMQFYFIFKFKFHVVYFVIICFEKVISGLGIVNILQLFILFPCLKAKELLAKLL